MNHGEFFFYFDMASKQSNIDGDKITGDW